MRIKKILQRLFLDKETKAMLDKLYSMELLELSKSSMKYYRKKVRGNEGIPDDQARRKMTRNMLLAYQYKTRIENGVEIAYYTYGRLQFVVKGNKVMQIKNYAPIHSKWKKNMKAYKVLSKELNIMEKYL